jgi:hypothetical protein
MSRNYPVLEGIMCSLYLKLFSQPATCKFHVQIPKQPILSARVQTYTALIRHEHRFWYDNADGYIDMGISLHAHMLSKRLRVTIRIHAWACEMLQRPQPAEMGSTTTAGTAG